MQVTSDAEITFCTSCGSKIELGIHSYRTEEAPEPKIFCVNCEHLIETNMVGTIYSCNSCGSIICSVCAKLDKNKNYCPNCYKELANISKKPVQKNNIKKRSKEGTASKSKKRSKSKSKKRIKKQSKNFSVKPSKKSN
jgi:hypothetical protein